MKREEKRWSLLGLVVPMLMCLLVGCSCTGCSYVEPQLPSRAAVTLEDLANLRSQIAEITQVVKSDQRSIDLINGHLQIQKNTIEQICDKIDATSDNLAQVEARLNIKVAEAVAKAESSVTTKLVSLQEASEPAGCNCEADRLELHQLVDDLTKRLAALEEKAKAAATQGTVQSTVKSGGSTGSVKSGGSTGSTGSVNYGSTGSKVTTSSYSQTTASVQSYTPRWTYPGDIASHLASHGVNTSGMSIDQMHMTHDAMHDQEQLPTVQMYSPPVMSVSNCPNGQCPTSSAGTTRRGLFGGWRR